MFLKIAFFLFASYFIVDCKYLENWTKMKVKFEPSPSLLDGPMRLRVYSNGQMAMPFQIGTPPQNLNLSMLFFPTLDTILFLDEVGYVPSSKADPQTYHRNILNPKASSTFNNLSKEFSIPLFGSGYFALDNMNLQSIGNRQPQMEFILLTETAFLAERLILNSPVDGFLGLAPTEVTVFGMNSFTKWLMEKMGTNSTKMTLYFEKFNPQDPDEMSQNSFAMVDLTGKSSLPEFCNEQKWFHNDKSSMPKMPFWFFMAKNVYLESKNALNGLSNSKIIDQNVYE